MKRSKDSPETITAKELKAGDHFLYGGHQVVCTVPLRGSHITVTDSSLEEYRVAVKAYQTFKVVQS